MEDEPSDADARRVVEGLVRFNDQRGAPEEWRGLSVLARDDHGSVRGGLLGYTHWGWLFLSHLWIDEPLRGRGYGRSLLELAEAEAVRRGCAHVHLDTFSFQARGFYEAHGYEVFGALEDFPPGHTRFFLRKLYLGG